MSKRSVFIFIGFLLLFLVPVPWLLCATPLAAWPEDSVVMLPDVPAVRGLQGMRLLDEAPFVDEAGRVQVPLRFLAEEFGAQVSYVDGRISVSKGGRIVLLETRSDQAEIDGERVEIDSAPALRSDRVFVPLRFLAESLWMFAHYQDGVVVAGARQVEPSSEEAARWRIGIMSRWAYIEEDWDIHEITVRPQSFEQEKFVYFWRLHHAEKNVLSLCQSSLSHPDQVLILTETFVWEDRDESEILLGGGVLTADFRERPDALYALMHTGTSLTGHEAIYRFSRNDGSVTRIAIGRIGHFDVSDDYVYYSEVDPLAGKGEAYRVHVPSLFENGKPVLEKIGQEGFSYGERGFCVVGNVFYASGTEIDPLQDPQWAFYGVNLDTMKHKKLLDLEAYSPFSYQGKILFLTHGHDEDGNVALGYFLSRFDPSDGSYKLLLDDIERIESFYEDVGMLYYHVAFPYGEHGDWNRMMKTYVMTE